MIKLIARIADKPIKPLTPKQRKVLKDLKARLKRDAMAKECTGFTHPIAENIVLMEDPDAYVGNGNEYTKIQGYVSQQAIDDEELAGYPKSVLINTGHGVYKKLPMKTYKKLSKVLYMTIDVRMFALRDGEEEWDMVLKQIFDISSLNQLFNIIQHISGFVQGKMAFQYTDGWFTMTEMKQTVKILYDNDVVEILPLKKFLSQNKILN